jgi:hypothetical protein
MSKPWKVVIVMVLLAHSLGTPKVALGQQTINYASVGGRVTDATEAVMSGAQVAARETETNLTTTTSTDQEGRFRFPYLKPSQYEIRVTAAGFAETKRIITLTVGAVVELPVSLNVEAVQTDVTVTGDQPVLETARTRFQAACFKLKSQPSVNGRNFLISLYCSRCLADEPLRQSAFAETSAVPGQGVLLTASAILEQLIVDGLRQTMMLPG